MVVFAIDALSSFSHVPLQLATVLGFVFAMVAFMGIPVAITFQLTGQFVPGITTVLVVVLLLGGIQLITVGIIGEYLGRVYDEVNLRPLYVVRKRPNASLPNEREANRPDQLEAWGSRRHRPVAAAYRLSDQHDCDVYERWPGLGCDNRCR